MTIISLIAAVDENNGLGKANALLCHLPADLKHFKAVTLGKPIIMGRKTYESIGKALPGRLNIVLSAHMPIIHDATVVDTLNKALKLTRNVPEVMIIGGAKVFRDSLPIADCLYLTVIHHEFDADVFFPSLDKRAWYCHQSLHREQDDKNQYDMTFYVYKRIEVNAPP